MGLGASVSGTSSTSMLASVRDTSFPCSVPMVTLMLGLARLPDGSLGPDAVRNDIGS